MNRVGASIGYQNQKQINFNYNFFYKTPALHQLQCKALLRVKIKVYNNLFLKENLTECSAKKRNKTVNLLTTLSL